jgi:Zn-dependent protease with chaperone function
MYYGGKNLEEALYYFVVACITCFLVLFDSFGVMRLVDCSKKRELEEIHPELFNEVMNTATNCGCKIQKFYLVDSGDTNHSNAYVDGVCCDKKCVISDSLIEDLPNKNQLLAVVRHEIGHSKMNHVLKNAAVRCLFYTLLFVCISACVLHFESEILTAFRVEDQSLYVTLFIVGNFAMSVFLYLFEIFENVV